MDVMRHGQVDANQPAIVEALRAIGCSVQILSDVGGGCPDLLVGRGMNHHEAPRNYLLECKAPDGVLNSRQAKWHREWAGQVAVVHSPEEAVAVVTFATGRTGRPTQDKENDERTITAV